MSGITLATRRASRVRLNWDLDGLASSANISPQALDLLENEQGELDASTRAAITKALLRRGGLELRSARMDWTGLPQYELGQAHLFFREVHRKDKLAAFPWVLGRQGAGDCCRQMK
jgi:hypothetical protein